MEPTLRATLVPVGDHFHVVIPRDVAESNGFSAEVDIYVSHREISVRPAGWRPREGWAEEIARMTEEELSENPWEGWVEGGPYRVQEHSPAPQDR